MHVRTGWSGEVEPNRWAKTDVELDEIDLHRILRGAGLPETTVLDLTDAYQLLEGEGERLLTVKLITRYGYPEQQGLARLAELKRHRTTILDRLRGDG